MARDSIINRWDINGDVYDIQDAGRGRPLGVATLDENGRVPYTQLPESAVEFKGYWNASTNTPTLADGTGTKGDMYYVDVAGSQNLGSGIQYFNVGDRILYDGAIWKNMSGDYVKTIDNRAPDSMGNIDLINFFLPVGHIIWTSDSTFNPNTLYTGTTWVRIKDAFVYAAGDNDTINATGGAKTHTITANELPTHTHAIGGTTGSESSHTHGLGSHTHTLTNGTAKASSAVSQPGSRKVAYSGDNADGKIGLGSGQKLQSTTSPSTVISVTTTLSGRTDGPSTNTSGAGSSHSHTLPANTGNNTTTATSMSIMPPYIIKYCWERTA